jgi:hypothetical protein
MFKEHWVSLKEWWGYVPRRWWDMVNLVLTLAPIIAGIIGLIVWSEKSQPSPPLWAIILIIAGVLFSQIVNYLAFHRMRLARDNAIANPNNEYVNKKLIDSKMPVVLEITSTLQKMADFQNNNLTKLFARKPKVVKLNKIQSELRKRINVEQQYHDINIGDSAKIKLIDKQMKKLDLYTKDFSEGIVPFIVGITWVLDDNNVGLPIYLDCDEYNGYKKSLEQQTKNVASDELGEMILMYEDLALGFNSMIAYVHFLPKSHITQSVPEGVNKSIKQLMHERDQILRTFLQKVNDKIELELKR